MLKDGQIQFDFPSFYNTVGLVGPELEKNEVKAKSLEQFILDKVFKPGLELSPYDVLEKCIELNRSTKENSVRRAIHNLTKKKWDHAIVFTGKRTVNPKYSSIANATYKLK